MVNGQNHVVDAANEREERGFFTYQNDLIKNQDRKGAHRVMGGATLASA